MILIHEKVLLLRLWLPASDSAQPLFAFTYLNERENEFKFYSQSIYGLFGGTGNSKMASDTKIDSRDPKQIVILTEEDIPGAKIDR